MKRHPVFQSKKKIRQDLLDLARFNESRRKSGKKEIKADHKHPGKALDLMRIIEKKAKRAESKKDRIYRKREWLYYQGYEDARSNLWSDTRIDQIKLSDIKSNTVTAEKYPWLDSWNVKFKIGKGMTFAFNDYTLEHNLADLLSYWKKKSVNELLSALKKICEMIPTADPDTGKGSGGSAAGAAIYTGDKSGADKFINRGNKLSRLIKKHVMEYDMTHVVPFREHRNNYIGWQFIANENGSYHWKTMTKKEALIILNAIMWNTTESDRRDFYGAFKDHMKVHCTEIYAILPDLKYF